MDRAKLDATSDAEIDRQIASDPDLAPARQEADIADDLRAGRAETVPPFSEDVRAVRAALGLSQEAFAARFGFPLASLRNWEQGRRRPEGAARTLLQVIAKEPDAVRRALSGS